MYWFYQSEFQSPRDIRSLPSLQQVTSDFLIAKSRGQIHSQSSLKMLTSLWLFYHIIPLASCSNFWFSSCFSDLSSLMLKGIRICLLDIRIILAAGNWETAEAGKALYLSCTQTGHTFHFVKVSPFLIPGREEQSSSLEVEMAPRWV